MTRVALGRLFITPGARRAFDVAGEDPAAYVRRHQAGEWGEVDAEDRRANDRALRDGTRLLSAYVLGSGVRVWIITEWDRSVTTILLPEEY